MKTIERRDFIKKSLLGSSLLMINPMDVFAAGHINTGQLPVYCQEFTWITFLEREGKTWFKTLGEATKNPSIASLSGMEVLMEMTEGYPIGTFKKLNKNKIDVASMFVSLTVHIESVAQKQVGEMLKVGAKLKQSGIDVMVVSPEAKEEDLVPHKTDAELKIQSKALDVLGAGLSKIGIRMLYHNHDTEMENDAKEFNHVLAHTKPENLGLCLDADWVYKGTGSLSALYGLVDEHAKRIEELHLRQTQNGIWTETFGEGDIDYSKIADMLLKHNQRPALFLEQAADDETPHTMDAIKAIGISIDNVRDIFSDFNKQ
ncbi:TIM barrel protein [Seonamhaeicola sp.]|uniref:sugar phosphate isomerase/epimerase family protein n=1 Tax=Seonamhaeicola sp. TaxID=1912245 RepID=UPI002601B0F3|nr:TIM barrel protein [Seonamhaeicola sp.]